MGAQPHARGRRDYLAQHAEPARPVDGFGPERAASPYAAALLAAVALIIFLWVARYCFEPRNGMRKAKRTWLSHCCWQHAARQLLLLQLRSLRAADSDSAPERRNIFRAAQVPAVYRGCVLLLLTSPLYWWLLFRVDRFYLVAIVLAGLAMALAGMAKARAYAVRGSS